MWDGVRLCRRGADTASQYQPSLLRGTDLAVQPKILSSEENIYVTSTKKTSTRQRSSAAIMISSFKRLLRLMTCTAFHLHHLWDHHLCTRATLPTSGARLTERGWTSSKVTPHGGKFPRSLMRLMSNGSGGADQEIRVHTDSHRGTTHCCHYIPLAGFYLTLHLCS